MRRRVRSGLLALAFPLALAACGGSAPTSGPTTTARSHSTTTAPGSAAAGLTSERSAYGTVLATKGGQTLYMLTADTPTASACTTSACVSIWPPMTAAAVPEAAPGVDKAKIGDLVRADSSHQVTYGGHPLYTYAGDSGTGQANGEGIVSFGGTWYVVSAATGQPVTSKSPSESGSGTTTTGGGYGY